jgi:hypothetical protein
MLNNNNSSSFAVHQGPLPHIQLALLQATVGSSRAKPHGAAASFAVDPVEDVDLFFPSTPTAGLPAFHSIQQQPPAPVPKSTGTTARNGTQPNADAAYSPTSTPPTPANCVTGAVPRDSMTESHTISIPPSAGITTPSTTQYQQQQTGGGWSLGSGFSASGQNAGALVVGVVASAREEKESTRPESPPVSPAAAARRQWMREQRALIRNAAAKSATVLLLECERLLAEAAATTASAAAAYIQQRDQVGVLQMLEK